MKLEARQICLTVGCIGVLVVAQVDAAYDLPIGGPKEIVPEWQQQRNMKNAIKFIRDLPLIQQEISQTMLSGGLPVTPEYPGWSADVQGQISPLGQYTNSAKLSEYFFVLPAVTLLRSTVTAGGFPYAGPCPDPDVPCLPPGAPIYAKFVKTAIQHIGTAGNTVHYQVSYYNGVEAGGQILPDAGAQPTFTIQGRMFHDREGKICGYDVGIPHSDSYFASSGRDVWRQAGSPTAAQLARLPDSPFKAAYMPQADDESIIHEICRIATGPVCSEYEVYASFEECLELLGQKREGSYGEGSSDTLLCRGMHRILVPGNPKEHCRHLGSDFSEEEGGVCIDRTTAAYNARNFQCGYDDVGYVVDSDWETKDYPNTPENKEPGSGIPFSTSDLTPRTRRERKPRSI